MLAFKIRYRTVERGQPRKIELVPVHRPDAPPAHAPVNTVNDDMIDRIAREAGSRPSVH